MSNMPICPHCKIPMKIRKGKYGDFFGCTNYPRCKFTSKRRYFAGNRTIELAKEGRVSGSFGSKKK